MSLTEWPPSLRLPAFWSGVSYASALICGTLRLDAMELDGDRKELDHNIESPT